MIYSKSKKKKIYVMRAGTEPDLYQYPQVDFLWSLVSLILPKY